MIRALVQASKVLSQELFPRQSTLRVCSSVMTNALSIHARCKPTYIPTKSFSFEPACVAVRKIMISPVTREMVSKITYFVLSHISVSLISKPISIVERLLKGINSKKSDKEIYVTKGDQRALNLVFI